jgi:hypothetical protein
MNKAENVQQQVAHEIPATGLPLPKSARTDLLVINTYDT